MKVYFCGGMHGDRSKLGVYKHIIHRLQKMGHEVLTTHIIDEKKIKIDMKADPKVVFERDMRWLDECEVVVAEVSGPSFGVGFEVAAALYKEKKKVFMLYDRKLTAKVSSLASGCTDKNCEVIAYSGMKDVDKFLDGFSFVKEKTIGNLRKAKAFRDVKNLKEVFAQENK